LSPPGFNDWAEDFFSMQGGPYDLNMLEGQNITILRFASEYILKLKTGARGSFDMFIEVSRNSFAMPRVMNFPAGSINCGCFQVGVARIHARPQMQFFYT